jgi:hypothetical protein
VKGLSIKTMEPINLEEDDGGLFIEYQKNTRRATTQHKYSFFLFYKKINKKKRKLYMHKRKAHPYKIEDALPDSRQLGVDILLGIIYDTMPSG